MLCFFFFFSTLRFFFFLFCRNTNKYAQSPKRVRDDISIEHKRIGFRDIVGESMDGWLDGVDLLQMGAYIAIQCTIMWNRFFHFANWILFMLVVTEFVCICVCFFLFCMLYIFFYFIFIFIFYWVWMLFFVCARFAILYLVLCLIAVMHFNRHIFKYN